MSTGLQPVDLTGATVGTTGNIDLTQVLGPGGISYAQGSIQNSIPTLRLHNESNCGLFCSFNNSGQSFNLPAGGWSDCYPKSSDNALDFTVLYTLSGPGVTLLLATYYFPGEPVPSITTLGNSPIGGGNLSTNFSELVNTNNNPGTTIINVQPNDATAPTWSADNSGNLLIKSDNAGTLNTLLQLVAGAIPAVQLGSSGILTSVEGSLRTLMQMGVQEAPNANIALAVKTVSDTQQGVVIIAFDATQSADLLRIESSGFSKLFWIDANGNANLANNVALQSLTTGGVAQDLISLNATNNTSIEAPSLQAIQFLNGLAVMAQIDNVGFYCQGGTLSLGSNTASEPITLANGSTVSTFFSAVTVTNLAAVTGIILAIPGQTDGTLLSLINIGAGSITFAAQATSHVKSGASIVIGAGNTALFIFSPVDSLWHRIVAN